MSHETETREQAMPFPTLDIPEEELGWMNETQRYEYVIKQLRDRGLYIEDALYCGIDAAKLLADRSFGDRTETWAVDEEGFRKSAEELDRYGDGMLAAKHNPLVYALSEGYKPAVAVYRLEAFTNLGGEPDRNEHEWRLMPEETMDGATVAVVYLAS